MKPTTCTKQFYLYGDVSTTQDIDVPSSIDETGIRHLAASHFAIVESRGQQIQDSRRDRDSDTFQALGF